MSSNELKAKLDPCGCCETGVSQPEKQNNRPGKSSLNYRLNTHTNFLQRMLARLHTQEVTDDHGQTSRPLSALTTRSGNDPAIAMLDAWATVGDVLTFYQERIANEGFLGTATERRSVLELARTIGYELNPGVAASTYLAFTVEDAPGAPSTVTIPGGTRVQSIPGQDEMPQTFETTENFEAYARWNELRPRTKVPQVLTEDMKYLYLDSPEITLEPGDLLLLVLKNEVGEINAISKKIKEIQEDSENGLTRIEFTEGEEIASPEEEQLPPAQINSERVELNGRNIRNNVINRSWDERNFSAFRELNDWPVEQLYAYLDYESHVDLGDPEEGIFAFLEKVGIFGNNAPYFKSLPKDIQNVYNNYDWDARGEWLFWKDSLTNTKYGDGDIFLERIVDGIERESWLVLDSPDRNDPVIWRIDKVFEKSKVGFGMSSRVTGLDLVDEKGDKFDQDQRSKGLYVRSTTAYLKNKRLELAEIPITEELTAGATDIELNNLVLGLHEGQPVALQGEQADAEGVIRREILHLHEITHNGGNTTLYFFTGLQHSYKRDTVTINANVVHATHGETIEEVLGSGDASQANQRFVLKKPPLTYISAPSASGSQGTLKVRVDGILWDETASLFGLDAKCQNYVLRHENDGTTSITFGDGTKGSRLPSGQENITASYRSGIGPEGEVATDSLTLLQTRPMGIREVTNPLPATGAGASEKLDDARTNAPLTVLTLDRIVSLQDFEDFARAFAAIGKARAIIVPINGNRLIHITIASATGDAVEKSSDLYKNLVAAIDSVRDPKQQIRVDSFQLISFNLSASIQINKRFQAEQVLTNISFTLKQAFSFVQRQFGQGVTSAEILATIHQVDGVIAVDLDKFHLAIEGSNENETPAIIPAHQACYEKGEIQLAQLLVINPVGIELKEMK